MKERAGFIQVEFSARYQRRLRWWLGKLWKLRGGTGRSFSYDLNYRDSLWKSIGGKKRACEVNRELAVLVDVMLGNEEDFPAALGF